MSSTLENLIVKVTQKAYANSYNWMSSDTSISAQLRDGVRTARNSFAEIDNQIDEETVILELMLEKLQTILIYYRNLPGDYGQWECSALNIIKREIEYLLPNG